MQLTISNINTFLRAAFTLDSTIIMSVNFNGTVLESLLFSLSCYSTATFVIT
jgi:hypothetical protein